MSMGESIIAQFHNQKDGNFNPESGAIETVSSKKIDALLDTYDQEAEKTENHMKASIRAINNAELEQTFEKNKEQKSLLKKRKEEARKMILEVLHSIENYILAIKKLEYIKEDGDKYDQKIFLQLKKDADAFRTTNHNALISKLKATIRYVTHTFGDINESAIEKWEENLEKLGQKILMVDRKKSKISSKAICPDNINLDDRNQIAEWAVKLYHSLSQIKKELSE
jgi:thiol-disulfide isomerase/thioredoxin